MTSSPTRTAVVLLAIAVLTTSDSVSAQNGLGSERADFGNFRGDIWSVWTSPAHTTGRDALTVGAVAGSFLLTSRIDSASYAWMHSHERTFAMRLLSPVREGVRFSPYEYGSGQYLLPTSILLYTMGRLSKSKNLRDAGLGCAAGHLASLGVRQVVFRSVARARPAVTPNPFDFSVPGSSDWSRESFYSGHISNSMACASFLGHRFSLGLAEPLPYIFSTGIGLGRLADGHHWPSDMMLGGVIGFSVGKLIAQRQLRRQETPVAARASVEQHEAWRIPVMQWSIVF